MTFVDNVVIPQVVEALAVKEAILWLITSGLHSVIVEGDALSLVQAVDQSIIDQMLPTMAFRILECF